MLPCSLDLMQPLTKAGDVSEASEPELGGLLILIEFDEPPFRFLWSLCEIQDGLDL